MERAEAIKIIKTATVYTPEEMEALETLIPELNDNEDKRINRAIFKALSKKDARDVLLAEGIQVSDALTYLKKQEEQPQEELVYRMNGLMQEYIKEGKDEAEKEHRFKCYQLFWDALEDANFFEQKEQKPWKVGANAYFTPEQKPAEWSEEDELMRTTVIQTLERFGGCGTTGMQIDWLKSLRPSWKPSEEDIKMLEHIIGQYETGNKNSKVMGYLPRVEELSFLKNVLSKWKN
ncbi:MAG: hypothetical protein IKH15_09205 [Bacteroidales bacterium]|nr:hypothetical protein [Bacteroidales bacterium]